jgi:hypothetical protein
VSLTELSPSGWIIDFEPEEMVHEVCRCTPDKALCGYPVDEEEEDDVDYETELDCVVCGAMTFCPNCGE